MSKPYATNQEKLNLQVAELVPEYVTQRAISRTKTMRFKDILNDKLLLSAIIRQGIPYSFFKLVQNMAPFSEHEWADLLNISTKSLQRYREEKRHLKPLQSEKILEMAEVTELGMEVFGDMNKFKLWLDTPNYALGNLRPKELVGDSYGKELVVGELTRINYGILV